LNGQSRDKAKGKNKGKDKKEPKAPKGVKEQLRPQELRQQTLGGR
jgi:hypothetical protein